MWNIRGLIVIATAFFINVAHADTYNYICTDLGRPYVLRVDDEQNTLTWKGSIYTIEPLEDGKDCAKFGWRAQKHDVSFNFCTATQGGASFKLNDTDIVCDQKRLNEKAVASEKKEENSASNAASIERTQTVWALDVRTDPITDAVIAAKAVSQPSKSDSPWQAILILSCQNGRTQFRIAPLHEVLPMPRDISVTLRVDSETATTLTMSVREDRESPIFNQIGGVGSYYFKDEDTNRQFIRALAKGSTFAARWSTGALTETHVFQLAGFQSALGRVSAECR